ncbi:MAG: hypothetical protein CVV52_00295 [Spirochaetae bacterium HGW-Spirochaetae-8]|nr:MAG: hypothetical protein CVV52_00295 [Spirochaetae bacterium HGW-Spirochaetae-8]
MLISPTERRVLFQTSITARQVQKYVEAKGSVGLDAICEVFSDVSRRNLRHCLLQLCQSGAMVKDSGVYIASHEYTTVGSKADCAWRAARILSSFEIDNLAKVAGIDREHAATLCRTWLSQGFLITIGRNGKAPIYKLISNEVVRPIIYQKRGKK